MNSDPTNRLQELFINASAIPVEERQAWLIEQCGGDESLLRDVLSLLKHHVSGDGPLEQVMREVHGEAECIRDMLAVSAEPETGETASVDSGTKGSPEPGSLDQVGRVVGPYKLLQRIGEGGMGTVYLAEQEKPVRRRVALKIIKPGLDTKQVIARFEAERQALAMMDHNNIARVLDVGATDDGHPYFAMELVKGIPITKYCDDNKLSLQERLKLFTPVCHAIQHAHQKGIIHRDIKPSNVLIGIHDGVPIVKVIDFGVAKATHQKLTEKTMFTALGQVVGTLEYMSPEQAEMNQLDIDTRSDVYSLGVMLYELLAGTTPITAEQLRSAGISQMLKTIREHEPPKPSTRLSESGDTLQAISSQRRSDPSRLSRALRGDLDWITMKALEKDRTRRYETANGLAADVRRYLKGEPVEAGPPSAAYQLRKLAMRYRPLLATAGAVSIILIAATATSVSWAMRAITAENTANQQFTQLQSEQAKTQAALLETRNVIDRYVDTIQNGELLKEERFEPLMRELLSDALDHFERYISEHDQVEEDLPNVAKTMTRIAKIHHTSGDRQLAAKAYHKALEFWTRVIHRSPDETSYKYELAAVHVSLCRLVRETGELEEAIRHGNNAVAILEPIVKSREANTEAAKRLADCYSAHAFATLESGGSDEAFRLLQRAIDIRNSVASKNPGDTRATFELARAMGNLGHFYWRTGNNDSSVTTYQQAISMANSLLQRQPHELAYIDMSGDFYGSLALALSDPNERVAAAETSVAIRQRLSEARPMATAAQQQLAGTLHNLGMYLLDVDEKELALEKLNRAISIQTKLAQEHPTSLTIHAYLGNHWAVLSNIQQELGQTDESFQSLSQSLKARRHVVEIQPDNIRERFYLARTLAYVGDFYQEDGKLDDAIANYQESATIIEELLKGSRDIEPEVSQSQPDGTERKLDRADQLILMAKVYTKRGTIYKATSHPEDSLASLRKAATILMDVAEDYSDNMNSLESLLDQYSGLATQFRESGQWEDARQASQQETLTRKRLAELNRREPAGVPPAEETDVAAAPVLSPPQSLLRFDGHQRLVLPELTAHQKGGLTVEAWVQIEGHSSGAKYGDQIISADNGSDSNAHFDIAVHPDFRWQVSTHGGSVRHKIPAAIKRSPAMTHLAIVVTSNEFRFFLDGQLIASRDASKLEFDTNWTVFLGGSSARPKFVGLMDEFRFSNTARYDDSFQPQRVFDADEYTLALYHFDANPENIAYDASSGNHHLAMGETRCVSNDEPSKLFGPPPARTTGNDAMLICGPRDHGIHINWTTIPIREQLTFECWVQPEKASAIDGERTVFATEFENFQDALSVHVDPLSQIYLRAVRNGKPLGETPRAKITPGKMVHVSAVKNAEQLTLFVGGHPVGSLDIKPYTMRGEPEYWVARDEQNNGFVGLLDELRVSTTACYAEGFRPQRHLKADDSTVILYHFDKNENGIAYDYSGHDFHAPMIAPGWESVGGGDADEAESK